MSASVHIVDVAARTPLGLTADPSIAAVRAGISAIKEHPFILDRRVEPVKVASDCCLLPELVLSERLLEMLATILHEIAHKLESAGLFLRAIPVMICLPEARPGWIADDAEAVKHALGGERFPVEFRPIEMLPLGHAAGMTALHTVCSWIGTGQAEVCIIAGVDSYLDLETLGWLDRNRQLATSYHRGAFFPGEGASGFVVASEAVVARFGLGSLATVQGTGVATETRLIKTDSVCLGEGLTACIREALTGLSSRQQAVDGIVCDINGERYRSEEWGFTLLRLSEAFVDPTAYDSPASCWGDMGAASGPLFVTLAVIAGRRGWAKGAHYLIWNSSEGGQRAAALLTLNMDHSRVQP